MTDPEFAAGFDFARALRDPGLRDRLRVMGACDADVLPAVPGTTLNHLAGRMLDPGRYLVVEVADGVEPSAWRMFWITALPGMVFGEPVLVGRDGAIIERREALEPTRRRRWWRR